MFSVIYQSLGLADAVPYSSLSLRVFQDPPLTQSCSLGDGLRQCREPSLWGVGIPADSWGSRMDLVAKNTNRLASVTIWEGEKVHCGSADVPFMWHRLLSDEQRGTRVLTHSWHVPELQPRGRTCPRLISSLLCSR